MAYSAQGTLFKVGNGASPIVYTTIPGCTTVTPPSINYDMLDSTSHDSVGGFKEFIPGLSDGGNGTAEVWFDPTNAIHTQLRVDSYAKTKDAFDIIFPVPNAGAPGAGATVAFNGYVMGIVPTSNTGQLLRATITTKVTGQPVWT